MNFLASKRASRKPSATNMISQINSKSGTTIAHGLSKTVLHGYQDAFICRNHLQHLVSCIIISLKLKRNQFHEYFCVIPLQLANSWAHTRGAQLTAGYTVNTYSKPPVYYTLGAVAPLLPCLRTPAVRSTAHTLGPGGPLPL